MTQLLRVRSPTLTSSPEVRSLLSLLARTLMTAYMLPFLHGD
ncbi:hypothetical protein [Nostoc sp. UHCC 0251]|nr:hypothetical protein [Nostoc sp. UHCC 0251]MEA5623290.1 hypothetical protein [Nostoc sp. UHCC 0251]